MPGLSFEYSFIELSRGASDLLIELCSVRSSLVFCEVVVCVCACVCVPVCVCVCVCVCLGFCEGAMSICFLYA